MSAPTSLWPPFEFPPECEGCPIKGRGKAFVPGHGNTDARLVIVLERPGREEEKAGRPTVGKTGWRLADALGVGEVEGLDAAVFRTNVRKCLVENETPAEHAASIRHCTKAYLASELAACGKARCVLAVGADASTVLVGVWQTKDARRNITGKLHGTTWPRAAVDAIRSGGYDSIVGEDADEAEEAGETWLE